MWPRNFCEVQPFFGESNQNGNLFLIGVGVMGRHRYDLTTPSLGQLRTVFKDHNHETINTFFRHYQHTFWVYFE